VERVAKFALERTLARVRLRTPHSWGENREIGLLSAMGVC